MLCALIAGFWCFMILLTIVLDRIFHFLDKHANDRD
jgi:hypothetical protein